jgi:acetylornithine deacetylase/succinyl-diaminopimelate desuccinylase-like protein
MVMERFAAYIAEHQARFRAELAEIVRLPSVSAQNRGITETATFVEQRLRRLGAETRLLSTDGGNPLVYATIGNGPRTLMIYDHYDVQPAEPLELWHTPPFELTERDGKLYGRGVADNKGNLMLRIQAVEAWLATEGALPIRIVFVVEGEEEVSSKTLPAVCRTYADLLRADGCLWETGGVDLSERPVVTCGAKGIQYVELVARGASYDLHSSYATFVPNPAWRLTWALNTLKGPDGRIRIPGFYDRVQPPSAADLAALATIPAGDDEALLADFGLTAFLDNVRGIERLRRHLFEPTCTICGLVSGYTGEGSKTVLPSEARAKIDFRLVPDMDPAEVLQQLRRHLDAEGFSDIEIIDLGGEHPARSPLDAAIVQAAVASARDVYGCEPILYPTMAGTGPMYPLCTALGTSVASGAGCGYHGSRVHSPNENIRLADYERAMRWMGSLIKHFAS